MEVFKVSSSVNPHKLAGALRIRLEHNLITELRAIGAGAVNQAVKAIAILGSTCNICCIPSFENVSVTGREVTLIRLKICQR